MLMTKSEQKEQKKNQLQDKNQSNEIKETVEEKLKISQDKLLRAMAEIENQRRRFVKEK